MSDFEYDTSMSGSTVPDERTPKAKQLVAMMKATMNLDLDHLINFGVIEERCGQECSEWTKWNKDAPMFIAKLNDRGLNSLAALISHKFPDAFPKPATPPDTLLRDALEALKPFERIAEMEGAEESNLKSVFVALGKLRGAAAIRERARKAGVL